MTVPILFEDGQVIVVDKPAGLASIPERTPGRESVLSLLKASRGRLYVVHRLDKEASGVMVFAKNASAHKSLNEQFSGRTVRKEYVALVHGRIDGERGVIDKPLRQFGSGRIGVDEQAGKDCVTEYQVTERFRDFTLVRAYPLTGRQHQIRVHFYSFGHPIVGDRLYGERSVQGKYPRLMLHAERLSFNLPTGERMTLEAPLPELFRKTLEGLDADSRSTP